MEEPGATTESSLGALGEYLSQVFVLNHEAQNFRVVCPDEVASNRLGALFEVENHAYEWPVDPEINPDYKPDGRIMEVLSEHNCQGWLQGYVLTGRHGIFPCYEAFIPIVDGMVNQYGKFLKMSREEAPWREPVASLNYLLTSEGWRQDHNGYSHQMPGFINSMLNRREEHARVYVPPDANTLVATMDHCLQATGCINLVIGSKLPLPQWLSMDEAREHVRRGASTWQWASTDEGGEPDLVLASCGTIPTIELLAAASMLREDVPDLKVRFVNVTNLFALAAPGKHPDAMDRGGFAEVFTTDKPVLFNFHGYPSAVHQLIHRRPHAGALPRARLRRGGHHYDSLRSARDERRRSLPAGDRGPEPRGHGDQRGHRRHVGRVRRAQHRRRAGGDRQVPRAAGEVPQLRARVRRRFAGYHQLGVAPDERRRTGARPPFRRASTARAASSPWPRWRARRRMWSCCCWRAARVWSSTQRTPPSSCGAPPSWHPRTPKRGTTSARRSRPRGTWRGRARPSAAPWS